MKVLTFDLCVAASVAWSLHRDLGFPLDLVNLMLEEQGAKVEEEELQRLIAESSQRSKVRLKYLYSFP